MEILQKETSYPSIRYNPRPYYAKLECTVRRDPAFAKPTAGTACIRFETMGTEGTEKGILTQRLLKGEGRSQRKTALMLGSAPQAQARAVAGGGFKSVRG
jgi:hypothetical protein